MEIYILFCIRHFGSTQKKKKFRASQVWQVYKWVLSLSPPNYSHPSLPTTSKEENTK